MTRHRLETRAPGTRPDPAMVGIADSFELDTSEPREFYLLVLLDTKNVRG